MRVSRGKKQRISMKKANILMEFLLNSVNLAVVKKYINCYYTNVSKGGTVTE